jgi:hypothetical protein
MRQTVDEKLQGTLEKGSGASADNSLNSTSEALWVALVSDEKWLEMRHL